MSEQPDAPHEGSARQRLGSLSTTEDDPTPQWLTVEPTQRPWLPERWRGARLAPGRRGAAAMVVVAVLAAAVGGLVTLRDQPVAHAVPPLAVAQTKPAATASESGEIVVSVVGLVHRSGLVTLPPGARVADALAAAGGATDGADVIGLNMAQRVADGDQIHVGAVGAPPVAGSSSSSAGSGKAPVGKSGTKVNLNTATEPDLDALPGVGPVTAAAIIAWRGANGRFQTVDQLGEIDGIGDAKLAKLRELVTV